MAGEHWQTTAAERERRLPCDDLVPTGQLLTRGVDTQADPATAFRWLCQLRVAPYSYDWIDNLGRPSPRELTPGLERLEVGQRFMTVFGLAGFAAAEHLTVAVQGRSFGAVAITYAVPPGRILMRIRIAHPGPAPERRLRAAAFPALDLVMARRQLLNLSERAGAAPPGARAPADRVP